MDHSSPNAIQVCLLYDNPACIDLRSLQAGFLKSEKNEHGYAYNVVEAGGTYFRCFGGRNADVMVFVEWVNGPTARENFNAALTSVVNSIAVPDAEALIDRHRGYLLINVQHGAMPPLAEVQELMSKLGVGQPGQSLPEYQERLRVLGLLATMATEISKPTLSHWTHTDILARPDVIKLYNPAPNPLNVHALPFRAPGTTQEMGVAGLDTFGAAPYIGREIRVQPTVVPWGEAYEHALAFIALAITKNGYIIPDGDTFGDEANEFCYRVHHHGEPMRMGNRVFPVYELEPLLNKKNGYRSPDYISRERLVDIDSPQPEFELTGQARKQAVAGWQARREMAERAGGSFVVKARVEPGGGVGGGGGFGKRRTDNTATPNASSVTGWLSKTFGRRD